MCSPHMTGSFSLLENLHQLAALAQALGEEDDARVYAAYHASFTKAFHGERTSERARACASWF